MGIYLPSMGIPASSRLCPLTEIGEDWEKICLVGGKYQWHKDRRCDDCPLVEVPQHVYDMLVLALDNDIVNGNKKAKSGGR